ncbi:PEPxxWA-CTERM sorting domain-containing protein [Sphingorhabdus sp.]|uniref:PEPxxWA-CTERM sorting domain-containing protein n=1 Tax=Sphingorhabdus sp. TaxID=1902408 RepID=UPI0039832484
MHKSLILLASMALATPSMAATNLVKNGSFESNFVDWTLMENGGGTSPVVITYGSTAQYPFGAFGEAVLPNMIASQSPDAAGDKLAYLSSDTANPHSLSQIVNLVANTTYNIGFDYYIPQNGIDNRFDASLAFFVGGVAVGSPLIAGPANTTARTWQNFTTSFTATTTGPQKFDFQFRGLGNPAADFGIDRVFAIAAPVPEPATWMMMLLGMAGIGFSMRRKKDTTLRVRFA